MPPRNMHQQAASALWTLTVLTHTVGMNHQHFSAGDTNSRQPPQNQQQPGTTDPALATAPQQHSSTQQAHTTQALPPQQQQQQQPQNCGPIHPAGAWPAASGGMLSNPVPMTPWLPPWVANQQNTGGYTFMAATQFQWQATHPAIHGGMVTSWGGYSLDATPTVNTADHSSPQQQPQQNTYPAEATAPTEHDTTSSGAQNVEPPSTEGMRESATEAETASKPRRSSDDAATAAPTADTYWDVQWGTTADETQPPTQTPAADPPSMTAATPPANTTEQVSPPPQASAAATSSMPDATPSADTTDRMSAAATHSEGQQQASKQPPWERDPSWGGRGQATSSTRRTEATADGRTGTKADTHAKERFAALLNKHMLPRDTHSNLLAAAAAAVETDGMEGCPSSTGPLDQAPPFTRGTIGRTAPMPQGNAWLLIITGTPHLDEYESNTMLAVEGDKFMIELTSRGWRLTVEHLTSLPARDQRPPTKKPKHVDTPSRDEDAREPPNTNAATAASSNEPEGTTAATTPTDTTPPVEQPTNTHYTTTEQAEAAQSAAGDDDSPVQWFEEVEDSPPHVSQLGEGRWHLAIRADKGKSAKKLAGLPLAVVEGEGGDIDDAPPLPIGLEGILEFLTEDLWVLTIELTPPHPNYEQDTMLLSPGDRLLLERSLTGWQIRVEHLDPNCPPPIQRLRQRRRETLAAAARNKDTAAAGTRGRGHLPSIPERGEARDNQASSSSTDKPGGQHAGEATTSTGSSSSHETPQSYYPQEDTAALVQTHATTRPATTEASHNEEPAAATSATQQQAPTTPIETPPAEATWTMQPPVAITSSSSNASSGAHLVSLRTPTPPTRDGGAPAQTGEPSSGSSDHRPMTRSWQRVEQKLVEIRRIAEQHEGSQAEAIAQAADTALIDLLVDTPTALQLEAGEQHTVPQGTTKAAAAISAAQQLSSLAKSLLSKRGSVVVPYAMVSSQVAALIEWLATLDRGSIAVHVQLPPVLTPLREILDQMLQGQPGDATTWARLVAVAEAFEALISGDTLTHPADVLGQSQGGTASPLLCADGVAPEWYNAVETLRGLLQQIPHWPTRVLPTIQQEDRGNGRLTSGGMQKDTMGWETRHALQQGTALQAPRHVAAHFGVHEARVRTRAIDDDECWQSMFMATICDDGEPNYVGD
ncbi:unnamed protein product [Symbiodinium necroappetens]|uniref:Uncharacterized protein n=1 Tax=Symbiodinium necroappetens TaxID=1628268 RepID=A0A812WVB1_9DINO|nr:unnamed protein product [Symbiodinium necroappetens]